MVYKVQVRLHDVVLVTKNYELYRLTKVHGAHIRAQGSHTLSVCVCVCVCEQWKWDVWEANGSNS